MSCNCGGDGKLKLLYSCSGSANAGYLADQVWRKLKESGVGAGTCLAGVGADLSGFLASAGEAEENIIIDGCAVGCGKKIFENRGLGYTQYLITDYGVEKGKTEITREIIERVAGEIREAIEAPHGR